MVLDHRGHRDHKVNRALLALVAQMVILDHKVIRVRKVIRDLKGHRGQLEHKVLLDL